MKLSTRLTVAMVSLVLLTAATVGFLIDRNIEGRAVPRALDRLDTHSQLLAFELEASVRPAVSDVQTQGHVVNELIRARLHDDGQQDDRSELQWRERLASRFVAELKAKPAYSKYRLIGIADGGREIVRVDRLGPSGSIRVVPENELQTVKDRDFYKAALDLPRGHVYAAPIDFARDNGALVRPHIPTLRVAAPVRTRDGQLFGVMVINIDMRPAFAALRGASHNNGQVYLVNDKGDFLVEPDRAQEFGWLFGHPARIQDQFPSFADLLGDKDTQPRVLEDRTGARFGVGWESVNLAGGPQVTVIETVPYARLLISGAALPSALGALLALLGALPVAVLLARSLSRPLAQMTKAVSCFARGEAFSIPADAKGEVGVLARAFSHMAAEVGEKTDALKREVDERRRVESEIREYAERERLFIAVVESSDDAVITKSLDGVITGWNAAAEQLFGFSAQEAVGNKIDIIVPVELRGEIPGIMDKIAHGQKVEHYETTRTCKDGRRLEVSLSISPVKSAQGAIIGAAKVAREITQRKKTEQALLDSERMARGIIDTALDAFIQLDDTGTIIDWSPKAEAMFGWSRAEAVGQTVRDLIMIPENRIAHSEGLVQFLSVARISGTAGRRYEAPSLRRDGKAIDTEVSLTALRLGDRYVINGFIRDVTEKKTAEEHIRQAQKMEAVGQLTGGIAHDFNNMLTVITGTIEILADAVADKPEIAAIATLISEAADRGAELTGHLLAFARKQPLRPREIDINALMADSTKLLKRALGEHIEIELKTDPAAWKALIDPTQLTSALLNLAVNARDAMPNGGRLTLETRNTELDQDYADANGEVLPGNYVMIAVSDTGSGIPKAIRDKIFEPFFSTKEIGKGTGLGLSMVYGFVKQSSGHINVYSEEGFGTTFKIYLPQGGSQADQSIETVVEAQVASAHETILLVEDDAMVRSSVTAQLESLGYRTLTAANGKEALAIIEDGTAFDLLFTDMVMPGSVDGRQLAQEAASIRPGLKVLFTSGYTEDAIIHHGRLDPGVLLLAKPYRKTDLARMIRVALDTGPENQSNLDRRAFG
jgi:PAS domain S-box-containing protein